MRDTTIEPDDRRMRNRTTAGCGTGRPPDVEPGDHWMRNRTTAGCGTGRPPVVPTGCSGNPAMGSGAGRRLPNAEPIDRMHPLVNEPRGARVPWYN